MLVPRQLGVYRMQFWNLRQRGIPITDTTLKTAVLTRPECLDEEEEDGGGTWPGIFVEGEDFEIEVIPEPSSLFMLGGIMVSLATVRRAAKRH